MSEMLSRPDPGRLDGALLRYRDLLALRWLGEQYAARMDHLEVLTGRSKATVEALVQWLHETHLIWRWRIIVGERTWLIPTTRGLRKCDLDYRAMTPRSTHLPHIAAINDIRLYTQMCAPDTLWVPRRQLMSGRPKGVCMPDGLAILDGQQTAIEVRLEIEPIRAVRVRLERFERRYDAVVYFCAPKPYRQLMALRESGGWPKLEVRELPNWEERL